jgi:hypothetical protein
VLEVEQQQRAATAKGRVDLAVEVAQAGLGDPGGGDLRGDLRQHDRQHLGRGDHAVLDQVGDRGLERAADLGEHVRRDRGARGHAEALALGDRHGDRVERRQALRRRISAETAGEHAGDLGVARPRRDLRLGRAQGLAGRRSRCARAGERAGERLPDAGQVAAARHLLAGAALQRLAQPTEVAARVPVLAAPRMGGRGRAVIGEPRVAPRRPVARPAGAGPAAGERRGTRARRRREVRGLAVDGRQPQRDESIVQRVPHPQRLVHRGDLRPCRGGPQRGRDLAARGDAHDRARRPRRRLEAGIEAQAVHQRPQRGDQVERLGGLPELEQPGDDRQRAVLRQPDGEATLADRVDERGLAGVAEEPPVQTRTGGVAGDIGEGGQAGLLVGHERALGEVAAGGEAAVGDLECDPRGGVGDRRARADRQCPPGHARKDSSPLPGAGGCPLTNGGVGVRDGGVERLHEAAERVERGGGRLRCVGHRGVGGAREGAWRRVSNPCPAGIKPAVLPLNYSRMWREGRARTCALPVGSRELYR